LVGSIFSYSSFAIANVSYTNLEKLQTIQNKAIRIMYKLTWNSPNHLLYPISKIQPLKVRWLSLGCKRITKSMLKNEYTVDLISEYTDSISSIKRSGGINTHLCCILPIIAMALLLVGLSKKKT
jgi:hypothetical protein